MAVARPYAVNVRLVRLVVFVTDLTNFIRKHCFFSIHKNSIQSWKILV